MITNNPKKCHELLVDVFWAYRTSFRAAIWGTPHALMFVHEAIIACEVNIKSLKVAYQNQWSGIQYQDTMIQELKDLKEKNIYALNKLQAQKLQV